jgi:N-acyl-L-homoserine lactone synthetase
MKDIIFRRPRNKEEECEMYKLRHRVYKEVGYFSDTNGKSEDIDEYDKHSVYFIACANSKVVGTVRLIKDSPDGFPCEKEFTISGLPGAIKREEIVEVSRLAVEHTAVTFDHRIMLGLIKCIHDYSREHGIRYWYAAIDNRLFKAFAKFGFAFMPLGKSKLYLGSLTVPSFISLESAMEFLKVVNPKLYSFFFDETSNFKAG